MTVRYKKGSSRPAGSSRLVQISRRGFLQAGALVGMGRIGRLQAGAPGDSWLELSGRQVSVGVRRDLGLRIVGPDGEPVWSTSTRKKPEAVWLSSDSGEEKRSAFEAAGRRQQEAFSEGAHRGFLIRLSQFPQSDLVVALTLALDPDTDELLIEVGQAGGRDRLKQVDHLYCLEKPTAAGGYLVVPHGSGYLIPADTPKKLGPLDDYFVQPGTAGGNTYAGAGTSSGTATPCPSLAWSTTTAIASTRSWRLGGIAALRSSICRVSDPVWISTGFPLWGNSDIRGGL